MVMTATPIPRSLALTVYGDLDLLVMDEMPPGRQVIDTHILLPRERERAYTLIRNQISDGHQAFIIYPLIEKNGSGGEITAQEIRQAAVDEHRRLQSEVFPEYQLGLLHGKLKNDEKEQTMKRFRDGDYQVIVSTSVVEVGVDIPNATVMLVEGANRFGLSQLHQFRGRVGRSGHRSYCLLLADKPTAEAEQRLQVVERTTDGFELAEQDLQMRGPGEFFGTRQHGLPKLKIADIIEDFKILTSARKEAFELVEKDPNLTTVKSKRVRDFFVQHYKDRFKLSKVA